MMSLHFLNSPSEGFPRLAYLGPGAGWDGGRKDFKNSWRSARPIRALGPRSGKLKITKRTSASEKNQRTFRSTRIDPSRQVIMTEAIFVHGKISFDPKMKKKVKKVSKSPKIQFHP